ncbi:HlyD family secretion protein [Enterococcus durans]|uniref:HlyD family secretion protein n=1 Tax=Enterococcus durans TaxID=53345 RepID=UPI001158D5EC|nr:HlyD family secretion protein [Enterococcus durans]
MNDMGNVKTSAELLAKKQGSTSAYIVYPFLFLLLFISVFLFWGKKETYIEVYGVLDTPGLSTKIVSPSNTVITKINIDNSSFIKKGDTLIEFDSTALKTEIDSINKNIKEKEEQLVYLNTFLDSVNKNANKIKDNKFGHQSKYKEYLNKIESYTIEDNIKYNEINHTNDKIRSIDNSINKKNTQINDYKNLIKYIDGEISSYTTSDLKIKESLAIFEEEAKNNNETLDFVKNTHKSATYTSIDALSAEILGLLDEKSQLSTLIETSHKQIKLNKLNFENVKNNVISEFELEKSNIETEFETEKQNLVKYESMLSKNTVIAPIDGTFEFSESIKVGSVVPEGTALGEMISHDENLNANLNISIPSSEISNIYEGQKIRFTINSKNNSRKKVILGNIRSISVQPKQTENGNYYWAYADVKGDQDVLLHGLEGKVSIITGENTYKNIIVKKLFG